MYGFENVNRQPLSIITLPINFKLVVFPTPIYIMLGPLSYKILLGRPWIHAMEGVPSTLQHMMNFEYNIKIYIAKADEQS
jgi:hypothetical protein